MADLVPRQPKRKRQPTAEMMREQLRLAADEIIRLRERLEPYRFIEPIIGVSLGRMVAGTDMRSFRDEPNIKGPDARPWWRRLLGRATFTNLITVTLLVMCALSVVLMIYARSQQP